MTLIDLLLCSPKLLSSRNIHGMVQMRSKGWKQCCNVSSAPYVPVSWPRTWIQKRPRLWCNSAAFVKGKIHEFWLIRGHFSLMVRYSARFLTLYFSVVVISRCPCQLYLMILLPLHLQIWHRVRYAWQKKDNNETAAHLSVLTTEEKYKIFFPHIDFPSLSHNMKFWILLLYLQGQNYNIN